jgi:glycosyltransferase involved in cell wall biosynthesis
MRATLMLPAPLETVSGGYGYDRRMLAEWRQAGHHVGVAELAGTHPLPDAAAIEAAAVAWAAAEGTPVIDGLALPAFAARAPDFAARQAVGLIHHPVSLEAGLDDDSRSRLAALEKQLLPLLPRIVVTSTTTAETLVRDFAVDAARITTIVPGTDPAPRCPGSGDATCQILAVGSLTPRKGHDTLLRALAKLFDLDWHLTIAGGPPDSPHAHTLQALAEDLAITRRVTFAGIVQGPALDALWARADLFALATQYEGYGMAIAEALARGLPCAITRGGAAGSLVPAEAGAVCEVGDVVQLSKSLRRMIFDTDLRRDMAEAAWRTGQALPRWDGQARAFASLL